MIVVFVGPTAAGKSTVMDVYVEAKGAERMTSTTERDPRDSDRVREYEHLDPQTFNDQLKAGAFCWHDKVRGKQYGTRFTVVDAGLLSPEIHVCALTFKGLEILLNRQRALGGTVVCVYLLIEDGEEWIRRLQQRKITGEEIEKERIVLHQWNERALSFGGNLHIINTTDMSVAAVVQTVDQILKQSSRGPAH